MKKSNFFKASLLACTVLTLASATYTEATASGENAYGTASNQGSIGSSSPVSLNVKVTKVGGNYYVQNMGECPTKLSVTDFDPESDTVKINWTETYDSGSSTSLSKYVYTITYNLTFKKVTE